MKIAIIADIHSNFEAFREVLTHLKLQRVSKIFCAGDVVGYNANPNECCELVSKEKIVCVKGNHDAVSLDLKSLDWFNSYAQAALKWTNKILSKESKGFLEKLPEVYEETIERRKVFMVHGSPHDHLFEYVYPNSSDSLLNSIIGEAKADILIVGHTHVPMIRKLGGKLFINPGSVGQPRDNNPYASYCILDTDGFNVQLYRIPYNINSAAMKIVNSSLPRYLADRLFSGR
ncbi:MAG: metallophosphoesterase family protein [Candidatus Nanoarchaeia archaeon]